MKRLLPLLLIVVSAFCASGEERAKGGGISIAVPPDWTIDARKSTFLFSLRSPKEADDDFVESLSATSVTLKKKLSAEEYLVREKIPIIQKVAEDMVIVEQGKNYVIYDISYAGRTMRKMDAVFTTEKKADTLSFASSAKSFDRFREIFFAVVASLKVEK
jgi:hypothetical protein